MPKFKQGSLRGLRSPKNEIIVRDIKEGYLLLAIRIITEALKEHKPNSKVWKTNPMLKNLTEYFGLEVEDLKKFYKTPIL